jgi:hypothetical protein
VLPHPRMPMVACVSAKDENTLRECYWVFPLPVACPQTWVHNGDTNWFVEQCHLELVKDLVMSPPDDHKENKGSQLLPKCSDCTGPTVNAEFYRCP